MSKQIIMKEDTIYLTKEFEEKYTYEGNDLGSCYEKDSTKFRVYAPTAEKVTLNLYKDGELFRSIPKRHVAPAEMEKLIMKKSDLEDIKESFEIELVVD